MSVHMNTLSYADYATHCYKKGMRSPDKIDKAHINFLNKIIDRRVRRAIKEERKKALD